MDEIDLRETEAGEDNVTKRSRKRKVMLILALTLGIVLPIALFLIGLALDGKGLLSIFVVLSAVSLMIGIVFFIVFCRMGRGKTADDKKTKKSAVPFVAVALEFCAVGVFFFGVVTMFFGVGLFLMFFALLMPIGGIMLGIVAMNLDKDEINVVGKIFALTAIFLPILTVLVFIILFSTGTLVFALM